MRYQMVWESRRKATMPSSRILARCCDSADWRKADCFRQRAHVRFAPFHQLAEDHQPALVAERPQQVRGLDGVSLEGREVECLDIGCLKSRHGRTVVIF